MFTSRFISFALLSYLAGANADSCANCPASVTIDGVGTAAKLLTFSRTFETTFCSYDTMYRDAPAMCAYNNYHATYIFSYPTCPKSTTLFNC
ncbi:uncharacterized protein EDB91DRAFT_1121788 [Suillus paluster]|uniref:uncharacterized protein n=1 Tax=Suillus paluster TaxID=48578 RepID=UPI001B882E6A|nr:uncharacterized protein EDB91DRAFT_1121788 [Suillus paluster]KAG1744952.1 hypothetical protein EDB91DRAFT_1121788 [Suillus paluster]